MLKVEQISANASLLFGIVFKPYGCVWVIFRPGRDTRTDCPGDSAIRQSVSYIWGSKEEKCKGE